MFHKKSPPLREHKTARTFTPNAMSFCNLQPAGEEVKAKNEKQLTRVREQTLRMHTGKRMSEEQNSEIRVQHAATQFTSKKWKS